MKKHLVIVGAGFAGMYTYKTLPSIVKKEYDITVIDRHNYFLFTPLLHEVATGSLDTHNIVEPLRKVLSPKVRFIQDTVVAFDYKNKHISLKNREILSYDLLVLGLGSQTNFFDTKGAQEHSLILKTLADAQQIRERIISLFQEASRSTDPQEQKKLLSIAVVGGGPTGVELAGELSEFCMNLKKYYQSSIKPSYLNIRLINGGPTLLSRFSEASQFYAKRVLQEKSIHVLNNVRIVDVDTLGMTSSEGEYIEAHTVIWAAGVMPQRLDYPFDVEHDKHRLKVNEYLQINNHPEVFVLGDMALAPTGDNRGYPMLAQVAKQQGIQTAANIKRIIQSEELKAFVYKERGNLVSLGPWHAIAEIGKVHLTGPLAWILWRLVYLLNFDSWTKRANIMLNWTINFFSSRDITKI